jgi:hypothetical protein
MEALAIASSSCVRCGTPPSGVVRFCPACWQDLVALLRRPTRTAAPREGQPDVSTRSRARDGSDIAAALRCETDGWSVREVVWTFAADDPQARTRAEQATRIMTEQGYAVAADAAFDRRRLLRWVRAAG